MCSSWQIRIYRFHPHDSCAITAVHSPNGRSPPSAHSRLFLVVVGNWHAVFRAFVAPTRTLPFSFARASPDPTLHLTPAVGGFSVFLESLSYHNSCGQALPIQRITLANGEGEPDRERDSAGESTRIVQFGPSVNRTDQVVGCRTATLRITQHKTKRNVVHNDHSDAVASRWTE